MSYSTLTPLSAFATVPSTWLAQLLANTVALHDGSGFATGAIPTAAIAAAAVTPDKLGSLDWYKSIPGISFSSTIAGTWSRLGSSGTTISTMGVAQSAGAQNEEVQYKAVLQAGTYTVLIQADKDVNRGIYTVSVDGVSAGTVDTYSATRVVSQYGTVTTALTVATSKLVSVNVKMATKNASSSGYFADLYSIEFIRTA